MAEDRGRVLVIDDDQSMCELVQDGLGKKGYSVEWRTDAKSALSLATEEPFDAFITDLNLGATSGLDVCKRLAAARPDVPVVMVTAFGDMKSAIAAIRAGAYDFINKPIEMQTLDHAIARAVSHARLRREVERLTFEAEGSHGSRALIGKSANIRRVLDLVERVAPTDTSVLITGESGTGKELVARALHDQSERKAGKFIALNCAAVPGNLLESVLFGHAKGAFTDAKTAKAGLFEQASGGTVLLDEVGEMSIEMQPKLLRVLEERRVRPVGAESEVPFDVRVVAATNRDLVEEVEAGRFREDLFYRLNVVQIHLPPLAARGNDILLLAQHFVETFEARMEKGVVGITAEAAKKLLEYDWPGNVRQLKNAMERAVTLTRFDKITIDDLPPRLRDYEAIAQPPDAVDPEHMLTLAELERRYIEKVLAATDGNKTQAARVLGLDRRTLYRKLERYDESS